MFKSTSEGVKPIVPGLSNVQGVNWPLITFDSLVDTDAGLLIHLYRNYYDTSIFDVEYFDTHQKLGDLIKSLIDRDDRNPLSVCVRQDVSDRDKYMKELYEECMQEGSMYDEILKVSTYTGMCDFLKLAEGTGNEIRPTIVCRRESEKDFVEHNITKDSTIIMLSDIKDVDENQQYFFRYIDDEYTDKIQTRIGRDKTIYLANYKFNILDNIKESQFIPIITNHYCRLRMYDIYNKEDL